VGNQPHTPLPSNPPPPDMNIRHSGYQTWDIPSHLTEHQPGWFTHLIENVSGNSAYACVLDDASPPEQPLPANKRWKLAGFGNSTELQRLDIVHHHVYKNGCPTGLRLDKPQLLKETLNAWLGEQACIYAEAATTLPDDWPTHAGLFTWWAYEAAWLLEEALPRHVPCPTLNSPQVRCIAFRQWFCFDAHTHTLHGMGLSSDNAQTVATYLAQASHKAASSARGSLSLTKTIHSYLLTDSAKHATAYTPSLSQAAFEAHVETIKTAIEAGELYQANLSLQWQREVHLNPWHLFTAMQTRNPSPFAALWKSPQGWILSNSPERLVKQEANSRLSTRPIAGTRGRGSTPEQDNAKERELLALEKERAEHLMLVDLERNDLGRVSLAGSVSVDECMIIERYSHVMHVVSNIVGQGTPEVRFADLMQAMHPGGTITGCPKLRCMELLAELEPTARGMYTGSLGYIDPIRHRTDMNILIRSVQLVPRSPVAFRQGIALQRKAGKATYALTLQAGAGIVADSVPAHEYRESRRKAEALFEAIESVAEQPPGTR
jgi:para-aminobenzoate synthetase component I